MKFKVEGDVQPDGSTFKVQNRGGHLLGYIDIAYDKIVEELGKPGECDGYKVDAEWVIEFEDGKLATIYNYKDGHNYNGDEGMDTADITDWHIGGVDPEVVDRVSHIFKTDKVRKLS